MKPSLKACILSITLKIIVIVSAVIGILRSAGAGRNTFMGGSRVFMFFTIQSNILIALICAVGLVLLLLQKPAGTAWYVIKYIGTVAITLTGVVFAFVLAPTFKQGAWNLQNTLTHLVVPVAAVLDFFVTDIYGSIPMKAIPLVTLPPLAYAIYAGIGYVAGWEFLQGIHYPYFFLNWGSPAGAFGFTKGLPFMGTVWWIFAIMIFLLLIGYAYLAILNALKKKILKEQN